MFFLFFLFVFLAACSTNKHYLLQSKEIHSKARTVIVLPFVNLTSYPHAGRIASNLMTTELYARTPFQIMEQTQLLEKLKGSETDLDEALDKTVAVKIGKQVGVDTVIYGTVTEFRYKRGLDERPVVGINVRMLDVKSRQVLWAASRSKTGGHFWFGEDSVNELALNVCGSLVTEMVKNGWK